MGVCHSAIHDQLEINDLLLSTKYMYEQTKDEKRPNNSTQAGHRKEQKIHISPLAQTSLPKQNLQ